MPHRTMACSEKGRKNSFLATRKKKNCDDRRENAFKFKRKLGHGQQVKKMKTRMSMINVGDATESFALANWHQDANEPMKNKRNFWQNPRRVRKKRRRAASPYYGVVRKKAENAVS